MNCGGGKSSDKIMSRYGYWHCGIWLNSHILPSFDPSLNCSSTELFMATVIAAIQVPWLNGTRIVFSDITNNYVHSEFHAVSPDNVDNKVFNSAPCANLVSPPPSHRRKGQTAKRPRMNLDNAGNPAKTGLSRRVRGRLSELPTMPLDILFEVCGGCVPS